MRARAIECQCYVVAAAQTGKHHDKRESYGDSIIIDPCAHPPRPPGRCRTERLPGVSLALNDGGWLSPPRPARPQGAQLLREWKARRRAWSARTLTSSFSTPFGSACPSTSIAARKYTARPTASIMTTPNDWEPRLEGAAVRHEGEAAPRRADRASSKEKRSSIGAACSKRWRRGLVVADMQAQNACKTLALHAS
eukprot:scaffold6273_cov376-Prasinococcus_capsulatus_cf.AAC.2